MITYLLHFDYKHALFVYGNLGEFVCMLIFGAVILPQNTLLNTSPTSIKFVLLEFCVLYLFTPKFVLLVKDNAIDSSSRCFPTLSNN